jgi:hypothetical protein
MRIVGEYLAKAAAFEALTAVERDPALKQQYADQKQYYRQLAQERQWMLATQAIKFRTLAAQDG